MTKEKIIEAIKSSDLPVQDLTSIANDVIKLVDEKVNVLTADLQTLVLNRLKGSQEPAK